MHRATPNETKNDWKKINIFYIICDLCRFWKHTQTVCCYVCARTHFHIIMFIVGGLILYSHVVVFFLSSFFSLHGVSSLWYAFGLSSNANKTFRCYLKRQSNDTVCIEWEKSKRMGESASATTATEWRNWASVRYVECVCVSLLLNYTIINHKRWILFKWAATKYWCM